MKLRTLLLFFTVSPWFVFAQGLPEDLARQKDSLINLIESHEGQPDDSYTALYFQLADLYHNHSIDSTILWLDSLKNSTSLNTDDKFIFYEMKGLALIRASKFDDAFKLNKEGLALSREKHNEVREGFFLQKLGTLMLATTPEGSKSNIKYTAESIKLLEKNKRDDYTVSSYLDMGIAYLGAQEFDSAVYFFSKGLLLAEKLNDPQKKAAAAYYMGACNYRQGFLKKAYFFYQKADSIDRLLGNKIGRARLEIGNILNQTGKTNEAIAHFEAYRKDVAEVGELATEVYVLNIIAQIHAGRKDYENAYNTVAESYGLTQKQFKDYFSGQLAKVEKDFDLRLKDEQNKALLHRKEAAESRAERERVMKLSAFGALLLLVVITVFIIRANGQRRKKNTQLASQNAQILHQKEEIKSQAEELRSANANLQELDSFKQRMMSMIVHDFKNPLNQIINQSQKPSVRSSGVRLLNMTQTFLDVHRFRDTSLSINKSSGGVSALCEKAAFHFEHFFTEKNISLERKVPENLSASLDFELCLRTLENLLSNALKFTPVGGTIHLTAKAEVDDLIIKVEDSGPGISEEKRTLIFKDFYQDEAKNLGLTGSSGLGLAFCQMAVKAHDGTIEVFESDKLEGAAFILRFPKAVETSTAPVLSEDGPDSEEINSILSYAFSETDLQKLRAFAEELQDTDFFMVTEIMEKASAILDKESDLQMQWLRDFEGSLLAGDEKQPKQMLTSIL